MFELIKNKKVYQHVIEQIQNMVMSGELKKGDKLPSERVLSDELGVSRTSIREALRALEVMGLLESRQGKGNYINGEIDSSFFEPLSIMFMLNEGNPENILELRMVIEVESASIAANKIEDEDVQILEDLIDELKTAESEIMRAKIDKKIHYKIANITNNYLIVTMLNAVSSLIETFIKDSRAMILKQADKKELLIKQHENICNAIINKDSLKARNAMREHLETINATMKKLNQFNYKN